MTLKSIPKNQIKDKVIIIRVDLNSPEVNALHYRFLCTKETIQFLLQNKAKSIILITHLGRPETDKHSVKIHGFDYFSEKLSLKGLKKVLTTIYKKEVVFLKHSIFDPHFDKFFNDKKLPKIVLLENIRFYKGEGNNDISFAKKISAIGDVYIDEGFSVSHRKTATNTAIKKLLPSYYGFNYIKEVKELTAITTSNPKSLCVIIGGAKISDKSELLLKFIKKVNKVLVGGAIANTFFKNLGFNIGNSVYENIQIPNLNKMDFSKLILPTDFKVLVKKDKTQNKLLGDIETTDKILDIGNLTLTQFDTVVAQSHTIFWNGPLGYVEDDRFTISTRHLLNVLKNSKARIVIGGGETLDCITKYEPSLFKQKNIFVSTGGGAMLDFLSKNIS